jgi:uncharacterized cupredoxin-like copper-binding protein
MSDAPRIALHQLPLRRYVAALPMLLACGAPEPGRSRSEPELLRLIATDLAFAAPAAVEAGWTRVRLVNKGQVWHAAVLSRLPDSATAATYMAEARAGVKFPVGAADVGGPGQTAAGDSSEVVLRLQPGRYAIVCWSDNHVMAGMIVELTVSAAADAEPEMPKLAASDTVLLEDFRFVHRAPFRSGQQNLLIRNTGQRPHNLQLYKFAPGRTLADFGAWRRTREGPPPALPMGGMETMVAGQEGWLALTLSPGRYFIACGTPEGDVIHAQMGMREEFEIS